MEPKNDFNESPAKRDDQFKSADKPALDKQTNVDPVFALAQEKRAHAKTKAELDATKEKIEELLESLKKRSEKNAKTGSVPTGIPGRVIGSNVTDHSHLGEAEVEEVPAQTKSAKKVESGKKTVGGKH